MDPHRTVSPPDIKPNFSSLPPPSLNTMQTRHGPTQTTFGADVKPDINQCNLAQPPPNLPTINQMHLPFNSTPMQPSSSFQNISNLRLPVQLHNVLPSQLPGTTFPNLIQRFPPPSFASSTIVSGVQKFPSMSSNQSFPMPTPRPSFPMTEIPSRPPQQPFTVPPPQSFLSGILNTPPPKLERNDMQLSNQVTNVSRLPYFDPSQPPPCIPPSSKLLAEPQEHSCPVAPNHNVTFPPPNFVVPPPLVIPPPNRVHVANCETSNFMTKNSNPIRNDRGRHKSPSPINNSRIERQELLNDNSSNRQDYERRRHYSSQKRSRSRSPCNISSARSRSPGNASSIHSNNLTKNSNPIRIDRDRQKSPCPINNSRIERQELLKDNISNRQDYEKIRHYSSQKRSRSRSPRHASSSHSNRYHDSNRVSSHYSQKSSSRSSSYQSQRSRSRSSNRSQRSQTRASSHRSRRSHSRSSPRYSRRSRSPRRSRSRDMDEKAKRRRHELEDQLKKRTSSNKKTLSFVEKWRMNNCNSQSEMEEKLDALTAMDAEEILEEEKKIWTRSASTSLYYTRRPASDVFVSSNRVQALCDRFKEIIENFESIKKIKPPFDYSVNRKKCTHSHSYSDSDSCSSSDDEEENWMAELELKQKHPDRLHPELWFNDFGEMNDGPLCRCSKKSRRSGIRHNIYAGEVKLPPCETKSNNSDRLYHYRITVSPPTNFLMTKPTLISYDDHEYIFEGFSLFSHFPLEKLPPCKVIRFNIQYTILYIEETVPDGFSIQEVELFSKYLFTELLELVDLDFKSSNDQSGCPQFHIMPRFVREIEHNGKELLPMCKVIEYLIDSYKPVISEDILKQKDEMSTYEWQDFADEVKGMLVTKPGSKPSSFRVDQLDRASEDKDDVYPALVHFGIRPPQLSYAGSPDYQKAWKCYVKLRHLLANKAKRSDLDKSKLSSKELSLQQMRTNSKMKRGVTVAVSSEGFFRTGIMCDIVQHAMLIPVLVCHLRFHRSLEVLEKRIKYKFKNRYLIQLALTHPSYREHFGTNPDHARNSLTNCGIRQPEYGDRKIHFQNTRKRGINTLINIMSRLGKKSVTESHITHNERLEFLGDAVVEFVTSIHLFHMFPDIEEGGLATYRAAIVQNQHLAVLAKKIGLDDFMLYAHGSDLCHELELKHAMANCYEALMGAIFLDGGIEAADKVFSRVMWEDSKEQYEVWVNFPKHPLQEQHPDNDRHWIERSSILRTLTEFEASIGVVFRHIRLLARAFTTRSVGYTYLTLGSNQRLEFLGDTVLQLITSEHLYNHFPEHHEGHLSLLRSSLVNNKTQSVVCDDLGIPHYANLINPKVDFKMKDRADLLEALLGAIYIDRGMQACEVFCKVCFFPRLQYFILNQEWNDPKSKLQQCCLTLRTLDGGEPDIPIYKVIECKGPTNSRVYTVAVYFQNERLATATGSSIQIAEMNAAKEALTKCPNLFPQLDHQKRVISKSIELQRGNIEDVDVDLDL